MSSLPAETVDNVGGLSFPTGLGPLPWLGSAAPSGWYLLQPGQGYQSEAITDWPALYRLVGTRWGGDGITTFAMPQAGLFHRGPDGTHTLWALIGEDTHTLTSSEVPATAITGAGNIYDVPASPPNTGYQALVENFSSPNNNNTSKPASSVLSVAGGGGSHNNIPAALVVNLIVKA